MGDIIEEMVYQMPNRFFWLQVLLPANMAITPIEACITIETGFLLSFL